MKLRYPYCYLICLFIFVLLSGCAGNGPSPSSVSPASPEGASQTLLKEKINKGAAFHRKKALDTAFSYYTEAEKLNSEPQNPVLLNNLGAFYFQKGDYDMAMDYYTRSIKASKGKYATPFVNRALIKEAKTDFASAYLDLKKACIISKILTPVDQESAMKELLNDDPAPLPHSKFVANTPPKEPKPMGTVQTNIDKAEGLVRNIQLSKAPSAWGIQLYAVKHEEALKELQNMLSAKGINHFVTKKDHFYMIFLKPGYDTKRQAISALSELKRLHDPRLTEDAYINTIN